MLKVAQDLIYPISNLWNEESNQGERVRRLAIFVGCQLWKGIIRKPITVSLFNGKRFKAYPDCQVSSGVLYARIPNSRNILFLRKHLSGGTLIDIGANVGDPHFPVSLVKIDVEGHENSVLRGMQKFVAEKRPPLVMFEYLQRTNLEETLRFFARVGYQVFELGTSGPVAATNRVAPLQDLFACPLERMPAIGVGNPTS